MVDRKTHLAGNFPCQSNYQQKSAISLVHTSSREVRICLEVVEAVAHISSCCDLRKDAAACLVDDQVGNLVLKWDQWEDHTSSGLGCR